MKIAPLSIAMACIDNAILRENLSFDEDKQLIIDELTIIKNSVSIYIKPSSEVISLIQEFMRDTKCEIIKKIDHTECYVKSHIRNNLKLFIEWFYENAVPKNIELYIFHFNSVMRDNLKIV